MDESAKSPMNLEQLLTDNGPWIGAVGTVVTLAALAFAFWAWARPKKGRLLCAVIDLPLGLPEDDDLEVRYDGERVDSPRVVTVRLVAGTGTDLTPANFVGGHLELRGHGISILGPIGTARGKARVLPAEAQQVTSSSAIAIDPCIVQAGDPLELSFLATWIPDWHYTRVQPERKITTRVRARLAFISAEVASSEAVVQAPFFELDAKLGNFKVVTPDQLAARRSRAMNLILNAAAVGRL